jgi:hypothetical protein
MVWIYAFNLMLECMKNIKESYEICKKTSSSVINGKALKHEGHKVHKGRKV